MFVRTGPAQAVVKALKVPLGRRSGRSKKMLFQIEFSKNRPIPPRIEVLPVLKRIPCESNLWGYVRVWLPHRISDSRNQGIQLRKRWSVTVRASSVPDITNTLCESEIWSDFPAVPNVGTETIVRTQTTSGMPERGQFRVIPCPVANSNELDRIIQRIRDSTWEAGLANATGVHCERLLEWPDVRTISWLVAEESF